MKNLAYFSLGSNIHPEENLPAAVRLLERYGEVAAVSSVWESPPLGSSDQPNYLNAAVCLRTDLSAHQCQEKLVPEIERALGRVRTPDKNAPRTIDIDLMLFNREVTTVGHRSIPNEEILERPFVAIPLAEIAPRYIHPLTGQTLAEIAGKFKLSEVALQKRTDVVLSETRKMDNQLREELIRYLSQFITPNKIQKIEKVLRFRTRYITIVLEDIYQPQNASATLRTSECLGVQDIHIIENRNRYRLNPKVTQGASKWVTLKRYNARGAQNTLTCIQSLKAQGYFVVATSPKSGGITLDEITFERKVALMFGNEEEGLSQQALDLADAHLRLPMYGFTQSYNISVSVAMTLSHLIARLHRSAVPWQLSEEERRELTLEWYRKIVKRSAVLEKEYLSRKKNRNE